MDATEHAAPINTLDCEEAMEATILIIDDNRDHLRVLGGILKQHGYAVRLAPDGNLGITSALMAPPDVILLDVAMPGMDGYAVCSSLKREAQTHDIPVIFLSAMGEAINKVRAFECGGVDYITKPFEVQEVLMRIQTQLTIRHTQKAIERQSMELAHANAELEERVAQRTMELRRAYDDLEQRVSERTAELRQVNTILQHEQATLRRVERSLRAVSHGNAMVLRATDETALLQTICTTIVEQAGYRMAWVGFAEQDEEKRVRPVAKAGYEEGYLETLYITWADNEYGRGPTGTAVRTGMPCVFNHTLSHPDFSPWRTEAQRRGYQASIALPLIHNDMTFGALSVYATEADAFDEDEVVLLMQLASNLAYGLTVLRGRAARAEAEAALARSSEINASIASLSEALVTPSPIEHLSLMVLTQARALTGSQFGYVGYIDPRTGYLVCPTLTIDIWDQCGVPDKTFIFEQFGGLWGWVLAHRQPLLTNRPDTDPRSSGIPFGHVPITRFVSVPAMIDQTLVGQIALANADRDYTEQDVAILERLAMLYALAVQREHVAQTLRESEQRYRTVVTNIAVILFIINPDGVVTLSEGRGLDALGLKPGELVGVSIYEAYAEHPSLLQAFDQAFHGHEASSVNTISGRMLQTNMGPFRDTSGNIVGVIGLAVDITDHKQMSEHLERRNRQLATINRVTETVNHSLTLATVLSTLHTLLQDDLTIVGGAIFLYHDHDHMLSLETSWGLSSELVQVLGHLSMADAHNHHVVWYQEPLIIVDLCDLHEGTFQRVLPLLPSEWCSYLGVPLVAQGEIQGVIDLFSTHRQTFVGEQIELFVAIGQQVGLAIQKARLFDEVLVGRERLETLSHRLVEVQEHERQAIARELHDEIGQTLTGLNLTLEMIVRLPTEHVASRLDQARMLVNDLMNRVREMSLQLRPPMLDDLGLLPALLWHVDRYTNQTNIHVSLKQTGVQQRFSMEIETAIYRMVQEALTNVARYADVSTVTVRLWGTSEVIGVQVEDQGQGFDPVEVLNRYTSSGLSGMRERLRLLGGELAIDAAPGRGCCLTVELPITSPKRRITRESQEVPTDLDKMMSSTHRSVTNHRKD